MLDRQHKANPSVTPPQKSQKPKSNYLSHHGIPHFNGCCLLDIPGETLTGITSYLEPPALQALAAVNKHLSEHIKDDNTWHRAFVYQFLDIGPEHDLQDDTKCLMLRRSHSSWRNEFIARYKLRRRWQRSRNVTVTHSPLPSTISGLHLMQTHLLLTSSLDYGVVSRSFPLTGRVVTGFLDAIGTRAGLGNGNPNVEFAPHISACAMTSEGNIAKVIWGFRHGEVTVMTVNKATETGRRLAADYCRCNVNEEHEGAVMDAIWDVGQRHIVTGGADGRVKLWDAKQLKCLWSSEVKTLVPDACVKVAVSTMRGVVVGVFRSGTISVWIEAGVFQSGNLHLVTSSLDTPIVIPCPVRLSADQDGRSMAYDVLALHIDIKATSPTILVAYKNDAFFYRLRVNENTRAIEVTAFGDPSFGPISSLVPFFTSAQEESSFIIVGDYIGSVSFYDWTPDVFNSSTEVLIRPARKFEAHEDGSCVTSLFWNGVTLVTGSARGTTEVWDALNFEHLRSFPSPVPRRHGRTAFVGDAREREAVRHIIVCPDKEVLLVSVGDRVMTWQAGPVKKVGSGGVRGRNTSGATGKKKKTGTAKYLQKIEFHENVAESKDIIKQESENAKRRLGKEREHRAQLATLGLSETEALEYALMLSREDTFQRTSGESGSSNDLADTFVHTTHFPEEGLFEVDFEEGSNIPSISSEAHYSFERRIYSQISGSPINRTSISSSPLSNIGSLSGSDISPSDISGYFPPISTGTSPTTGVDGVGAKAIPIGYSRARSSKTGSDSGSSFRASSNPISKRSGESAWGTPLKDIRTDDKIQGKYGAISSLGSGDNKSSNELEMEMDNDLRFALDLSLAEARSQSDDK